MVEDLNCDEDSARDCFNGDINMVTLKNHKASDQMVADPECKGYNSSILRSKNSCPHANQIGQRGVKKWNNNRKASKGSRYSRITTADHEMYIEKQYRELKKISDDMYHNKDKSEKSTLKRKKDRQRKTRLDRDGSVLASYCSLELSASSILTCGNFLFFVKNLTRLFSEKITASTAFDVVFHISTYLTSLGFKFVENIGHKILEFFLYMYSGTSEYLDDMYKSINGHLFAQSASTWCYNKIKSFVDSCNDWATAYNERYKNVWTERNRRTSSVTVTQTALNFETYVKNLSSTVLVKEMLPQLSFLVPMIVLSIPLPGALAFLKSSRSLEMFSSITKNFDSFKKAVFDFTDNILPHLFDGEFIPSTDSRQVWCETAAKILDSLTSPVQMFDVLTENGYIVSLDERELRTTLLSLIKKHSLVGNTIHLKKDTTMTSMISRYLINLKLAEANIQQLLTTSNYVEQPVVILWYGPAGCGKSELVELMNRHLTSLLGLCQVPSQTDAGKKINSMYTVVSTAKYMDGYFGQDIVLFDDFGATRGDTSSVLDIFLKGVGTIPYRPNQAELELKGKIQWAARLVQVTSNDKTCYLNANVYHLPAWNRRMSIQIGITMVGEEQRFTVSTPSRDGTTDTQHGANLTLSEMSVLVYKLAKKRKEQSSRYTNSIRTNEFVCPHGLGGQSCDECYGDDAIHPVQQIQPLVVPPQVPEVPPQVQQIEEFEARPVSNLGVGEDFLLSIFPYGLWTFEDYAFWIMYSILNFVFQSGFIMSWFIYFVLGLVRVALEILYQGDFNLVMLPYIFLYTQPQYSTFIHIAHNLIFHRFIPKYMFTRFFDEVTSDIIRYALHYVDSLTLLDRLAISWGLISFRFEHMESITSSKSLDIKIKVVEKTFVSIVGSFPMKILSFFGMGFGLYTIFRRIIFGSRGIYTQLGMQSSKEEMQKLAELDEALGVKPMLHKIDYSEVTGHPSYPLQVSARLRVVDVDSLMKLIKKQTIEIFITTSSVSVVKGLISGNTVYTVKHGFDGFKSMTIRTKSEKLQWCVTKHLFVSELFDVGPDIVAFVLNIPFGKNLVQHFHMSPLNSGDFVGIDTFEPVFRQKINEPRNYHQGFAWAFKGKVDEGDSGTPVLFVRKENGVIKNVLIAGLISGYLNSCGDYSFFGTFEKIPKVIDKVTVHDGIQDYDLGTSIKQDLVEPNAKYALAGHLPPELQPILVGSFKGKGSQRLSAIVETKWLPKFPRIKEKYCIPKMVPRVESGKFLCNALSAMFQMTETAKILNSKNWVECASYVEDHLDSLNPPTFETMSIEQACSGFDVIPSLNFSTSMGFPFQGAKGDYFNGTPGHIQPDSRVLTEIHYWMDLLSQGINIVPLVRGSVKDEVTSFKKRDKAEERIFFAGITTFVILLRVYYGSFMEWLGTTRFRSFTMIGINALGPEWGKLVNYLQKDGNRKFIDTDYSKFDKRMNILSFATDMVTNFILKHSNYDHKAQKIMRTLSGSIHQFCVDFHGDIYHYSTSTPSGVFGTSHFNCISEAMIEVAVFCACYGQHSKLSFYDSIVDVRKKDLFFSNIVLANYGDDNVKSAPIEMTESYYTAENIQKYCSALGYDVTSVEKDGSPLRWKTIEECTFLKRGFKKEGDLWLSPLETLSIEKSICFKDSKSPLTDSEWEEAVIKNMLFEAVQHGHLYYNNLATVLQSDKTYDQAYAEFHSQFEVGVKFTVTAAFGYSVAATQFDGMGYKDIIDRCRIMYLADQRPIVNYLLVFVETLCRLKTQDYDYQSHENIANATLLAYRIHQFLQGEFVHMGWLVAEWNYNPITNTQRFPFRRGANFSWSNKVYDFDLSVISQPSPGSIINNPNQQPFDQETFVPTVTYTSFTPPYVPRQLIPPSLSPTPPIRREAAPGFQFMEFPLAFPANDDDDDDDMSTVHEPEEDILDYIMLESFMDEFDEILIEKFRLNNENTWYLTDRLYRYYYRSYERILQWACNTHPGRYTRYDSWNAINSLMMEFMYQHNPRLHLQFHPSRLFEERLLRDAANEFYRIEINPIQNFVPHWPAPAFSEEQLIAALTADPRQLDFLSFNRRERQVMLHQDFVPQYYHWI